MKKKILLFISLVLLAVQGWATPVDSLNIHLSQSFQKCDSLDKRTFLDQTKEAVLLDGNPFIDPIIDWLTQCMKVKIFIDKSNMVIPVTTVGETETATFEVWGQYLSLYDIDEVPIKIEKNPEGVFSVNPSSLVAVVIDKENLGGKVTVTLSFTPQHAGTYQGKIRIKLGFPFVNANEWMEFTAVAVNPPSPTINVTKSTLNFGSVHNGGEKSESFNVSGNALTGDLSLMCNNPNFRVEPAYISADDAAKGVEVTVTYSPTESGIHNETLTISGGGATVVPVTLVGQCDLPVIECDVSAMYFGQHFLGDDYTKYFTVNGSYLTEDLHISSSDPSFIVNPPSVSRFDYNHAVAVTYKPTNYGDHDAIITISSSGVSYPINVSGSCIARPSISVDKTSLNFGTVKLGDDPLTQTITVTGTNLTGDLNLSITGSMFTAQPYRISPSDAAAGRPVVVTYKPTATGNHTATLVITGGGTDTTKINLSGKCVKPRISVNTTSLDFGSIEAGKTAKQTIIVAGSDLAGSISVKLEETVSGQFSINKETLSASGGTIIVTYHPTEGGSHGGCVRISATGATAVPVTVSGSARELSVSKTSLNFGTIKKTDAPPKQKFTVYGKNLTGNVTLTSSNSRFTVSPASITPEEAKAGKEVTVTYTPTTGGTHSGKIIVSASGVTSDTVSVSGKCAAISSNPASYNFGNVAVGKPVTKEITIAGTNLTGAMSITLAETEGGQYSINKTTLPASGGTVIVTFKPTDAKSFGASLNISGGSASAVSVSLTGKGVTPTITRNKSTLTFTGSSITSDYVKVTGTNLDDVISLTVTGSTNFTVSPSTISISDAADGKQVKVTCNPKNATSAEATLKISSPYASTKYVTLKYSRGSSGGGEVQVSAVQPEGGDEDANNEFTNGGSLETSLNSTTDVSELTMNSKVYAEGLNIIIESPVEQNAIISDISGRARSVNLQAGRNEIPVNASGIYIVRIREKTTKLMLK